MASSHPGPQSSKEGQGLTLELSASEMVEDGGTACRFGKKEGKVALKRGRKRRTARRNDQGGGLKERRGRNEREEREGRRGKGRPAFELLN